jgi:hypothetical protein
VESSAVNGTVTPGGDFNLSGRLLKVAGDSPKAGVFLVAPGLPPGKARDGPHKVYG